MTEDVISQNTARIGGRRTKPYPLGLRAHALRPTPWREAGRVACAGSKTPRHPVFLPLRCLGGVTSLFADGTGPIAGDDTRLAFMGAITNL